MNTPLFLYLLLINAVGFVIMLIDKRRAQKNLWRISESTLLTVAILGGSIGSYAGMKVFRHKTRKPKFSIGIPVIILLQAVVWAVLSKG